MQLNSFETSETDPAELVAASARCYLALGRLDGALAYASPDVLKLFALKLVRRTLARSLAAAGYLFTEATFEAWLSRSGGPPQGGPGTAAPASAIAAAVLAEMRHSKWPALAEAAGLVWRAAPQIGIGADHVGDQIDGQGEPPSESGQGLANREDLRAVIDVARQLLVGGRETPAETQPLSLLIDRLSRAPAALVPMARGTAVIETDAGALVVPTVTQHSHCWALGLVLGEMLAGQGVLRLPLPFAGSIAPEVLRQDCEADVRRLRLAVDIDDAASGLFADLDTACRLVCRADAALSDTRSTSRAPMVFAMIAGLGVVTRSQLTRAFEMTGAGVDGVLAKLSVAGLIEKRSGRAGGYFVARDNRADRHLGTASVVPLRLADVDRFDAAVADLDRLLERSNSMR